MPATLGAAEESLADFLRESPALDRANRFAVELLMREVLTNAVVHGCRTDPEKQVRCRLRIKSGRLLIAVEDDGEGFDWRAARARPVSFTDCSGRGSGILRIYANRVRYNAVGNAVALVRCLAGGVLSKKKIFFQETVEEKQMIVVTREDGKAIVRPAGDSIVAASIPELRSQMRAIVADGVRDLVIDLTNVNMVDSSGIGLLISAYNSLRKLGGQLAVINASAEILELFRTMRMHQHFSVSGN
jgi:anti-anti-sigma factor